MAGNLSLTREYARIFSLVRDIAQPIIFDNVSARTKTLFRMKEMGSIVRLAGMPHLRFTILKELPTTIAYSDLDTLTPVRADPHTAVIYDWKQLSTPVQVSGLDMIQTNEQGVEDLLTRFIMAAELSLRDALGGNSLGIFSSIADTSLTGISGFGNMFTTSTTTGTLGRLSRATQSNWQHNVGNVASSFTNNGLNILRTLYRQCSRFDDVIDTIVLTGSAMDNFERSLTSTFQVNLPMDIGPGDQRMIDAGFSNIRYKNAIVFDDDGAVANTGYFLNILKYVKLYVREGRDVEIGDFVKAQNRDDLAAHVLFAGMLATSSLRSGGLLRNADTWS